MAGTGVNIPISERARRFGYVIWPKALDGGMNDLLSGCERVRVVFNGVDLGEKRLDWPRRRLSVGSSRTRDVPESAKEFVVSLERGALIVHSR